MKACLAWRWTVTYTDGTWWGNCPRWAAQPLPVGAVLTRERVLVLGTAKPCNYPGCTESHMNPGPS